MTDIDPTRDLVLERRIEANPQTLWRCWTEPALLMQWFCPLPWQVTHAVIEPHPGGRFLTCMEGPGPDGAAAKMENEGCFLAVEPTRRLVFTDALAGGWRPNTTPFMTAIVTFEPDGSGTAYRAIVLHSDAAARAKHEEMGFFDGWGTAADQLAALAQTL